MSIKVHCAVYGDKRGSHELVAASLPAHKLPPGLRGLLDRPPGHLPSGLSWSPLFGCMPLGDFFALWRVLEDPTASRRGMVQSHVLLIAHADVAELSDLAPLLAALPRHIVAAPVAASFDVAMPQPHDARAHTEASSPRLVQLACLLTDPQRTRPVVFPDFEGDFEHVLQALWRALAFWPELRQRLSCQPAIEPSTLDNGAQVWMVVTPQSLASRWAGYPLLDRQKKDGPATPAAELLLGSPDSAMRSFREQTGGLPGDLAILGKLAYLATGWRALEQHTADRLELPNLLRILGLLAPQPEQAAKLKSSLISHASKVHWDPAYSLALANLELAAYGPAARNLTDAFKNFIATELVQLPAADGFRLVARSVEQRCCPWWTQMLHSGIAQARLDPELFERLWDFWTREPRLLPPLYEQLPKTAKTEALLAETCPEKLTPVLAEEVAALATQSDFLLLHATVLARVLPAEDLLRRQFALREGPGRGLRVLLSHCPPELLLAEALRNPLPDLVDAVGRMAAGRRSLLQHLDPHNGTYRKIWLLALQQSDDVWTGIREPQQVLHMIMDRLLVRQPVEEDLLQALAAEPPNGLLSHPRRAELWARIPSPADETFLCATAEEWLAQSDSRFPSSLPEEPLRSKVVGLAMQKWSIFPVGADILVAFAERFPETSESALFACLRRSISTFPLDHKTAERIGHLCLRRRWKFIIKEMYALKNQRPELAPLLRVGKSLLSLWDRISAYFDMEMGRTITIEEMNTDLWEGFLEVASSLYGKGPKEKLLWERAGGKNQELPDGIDGTSRWRATIKLVREGGAPPERILALLDCMLEDYPHNQHLRQLRLWASRYAEIRSPSEDNG